MRPAPGAAGRLLLADPAGRVVLVEKRLPAGRAASGWFIPGGGVEVGESPAQAAVRGAYEQTGIVVARDDLAELTSYRRPCTDDGLGASYDEVEHVYFARVGSGHSFTPDQSPDLIGPRWWTPDELRATDAALEPADLADLVVGALAAPRVAGRVLLLDAADRVLLVENNVDVGASATHWITPGGGADPGETPAQAAVREVREELGLRIELPTHAVPDYSDNEVFSFNGRWHDQTNHYFVVRLEPGARLVARGANDVERSVLIGDRWWSLDELRASDALIYPLGLADVLARLLCDDRTASA
jgi:8-oxo-dGTP pyrophosphatase MutT (NUDIX family)